jgi:hypothetical protein
MCVLCYEIECLLSQIQDSSAYSQLALMEATLMGTLDLESQPSGDFSYPYFATSLTLSNRYNVKKYSYSYSLFIPLRNNK